MPFWLSHGFFSFLIEIFSCPPVWGVILVGIFFMKEKIIQAQKGVARDVLISERERNNKDGLSSFQAQAVKINKLWSHPVWWFGLCKDAFHESWVTSSLHTIIHTFKNTWSKSHKVYSFLSSFFIFCHLNDGVAWFTCYSTSRMSTMNIKIFLKSKCQINFSKLQ